MTPAHRPPILRHIRRLVAGPQAAAPDRDLLRGYLECRDEAAFAALVERHGPMVLGVCRLVLRHRHDAEDAFQATFLVLAKKAHAIRRPDGLASWLHGVAYRVALRARSAAARRQALEQAAPAPAPSADDLSWGEVRTILHAELAALPERFRAPLVLCYLQGLTQEGTARRLGWPGSTVKGRLRRGRELLRRRLEGRGFGLAAALGAVALTGEALARPVAPVLAATTVRAALAPPGEAVAGTAADLARGVLGPSTAAKWAVVAAALLVAAALAGGVLLSPQRPADAGPPPQEKPAARAPVPQADGHGDPLPEGAVARLGTVRFNHGEGLKALFFPPDGKTVISEGGGLVRLWDAATGEELRHFASAAPSFDDQTVLSLDGKTLTFLNQEDDGDTVRVRDLAQGKEVRVVPLPVRRKGWSVNVRNALSPDGRLCAVHTPEAVRVFDAVTARELCRLPQKGDEVRRVLFAGNDRLVTADNKGLVNVWVARTGKALRRFTLEARVEFYAISADGRRLAVLERRWLPTKLPNQKVVQLHDHDVIHVWDLDGGTRKHSLASRPKRWHFRLRFSPDGKRLFAAGYHEDGQQPHELAVWDVETGRRALELASACERALAVSQDGTRLATGDESKFDLWDLETGRHLSSQDSTHALTETLFVAPAGDRVLTFGYASISTWDGKTGRRLGSFDLPPYPYTDPARCHLFSPNGQMAASLHEHQGQLEILVWDVAAGRRLHTLRPPGSAMPVTMAVHNITRVFQAANVLCAFSPDSSLLATWHSRNEDGFPIWHTGKGALVRLWDLRTGKELRSFKGPVVGMALKLGFTGDGKTLVVAGHRTAGFDVATGAERFSWRLQPLKSKSMGAFNGRPIEENDRIAWRALAVSPDGAVVACILDGGGFGHQPVADRLALCDAGTGKVLRRWSDSGKPARTGDHLAFSSDGRLLASSDGSVLHVWEVATGKEIGTFRGHRGEIRSLAFSANGRRLASSSLDSTVLLWDLAVALRAAGPAAGKAEEQGVAEWWEDLLSADARRGYAAVWRLAEAPARSVPLLRERLKPASAMLEKAIRQHIADLGSATFTVRQKAFEQLKDLGLAAATALREASKKDLPLEVRRRLDQLLEGVTGRPVSGEWLRTLRGLAVLEHAGTPEARRLLRELAAGAQGAWLTREAQAACERLDRAATRP
jgi:RNA polymerase sigma factor (sigma-70 family)